MATTNKLKYITTDNPEVAARVQQAEAQQAQLAQLRDRAATAGIQKPTTAGGAGSVPQPSGDVPEVNIQTGGQAGGQQPQQLINLPGVSEATKQTLGSLVSNGYQPSQTVTDALAELNGIITKQPGAFQSQYFDQLNNIMNQILGRGSFSYDLGADPMWNNYRQQYTQAGRQAMEDTMGRAAALTGGYGSSYAAAAGQQAYNQYLQQLNDRVPELYQMARDAYDAEGSRLAQNYALLGDAYQRDYGEWQDRYNQWLNDRDYYQDRYETERGYDYDQYGNQLNFWQNQAGVEQNQANADRDYFYNLAMNMLDMGKIPSDDVLRRAGLSDDDIETLTKKKNSGSGSSSGNKSTGSGAAGAGNTSSASTSKTDIAGSTASSALLEAFKKSINPGGNGSTSLFSGFR